MTDCPQTPKPRRIQRHRIRGWRAPPNTVNVSRPSRWGNPFRVGRDGTAAECVALYRKMLADNPWWTFPTRSDVRDGLRGKNLACYCPLSQPCHADVLLEIANG